MPNAIETHALRYAYGQRTVLDQIDLCVPERSVYGFLGHNGAGKTTAIKLLLGLYSPLSGDIVIHGLTRSRNRIPIARQIGMMMEANGLYPNLSGRENLKLSCLQLGLPSQDIDRVLELTQMQQHAGRRVAQYSLGMRQRLALARALLGSPSILILDEPTNGLDPDGIAEMRSFLRALPQHSNTTVFVSSHLLTEVEQMASHIGILHQGKLVLQGALETLKAQLTTDVVFSVSQPQQAWQLAQANGFTATQTSNTLTIHLTQMDHIARACARLNQLLCNAGIDVYALVPRQHSLESLYQHASH